MRPRTFSEQDVHLALDGELPGDDVPAFEAWLEQHADMKALHVRYGDDKTRLNAALEGFAREPIPDPIMQRVVAGPDEPLSRRSMIGRFAAIAAALLLVGGLGGYVAANALRAPVGVAGDERAIIDNAINAHLMYSAEQRHVVEVAGSDTQHLNSWLSKRVGVTFEAPDLKARGFELVGGRLLPAGSKPAAQFMYQDASGNRISLYITRYPGDEDEPYQFVEERGANSLFWAADGMGCAVTGTVPQSDIAAIAQLASDQFSKTAAS